MEVEIGEAIKRMAHKRGLSVENVRLAVQDYEQMERVQRRFLFAGRPMKEHGGEYRACAECVIEDEKYVVVRVDRLPTESHHEPI